MAPRNEPSPLSLVFVTINTEKSRRGSNCSARANWKEWNALDALARREPDREKRVIRPSQVSAACWDEVNRRNRGQPPTLAYAMSSDTEHKQGECPPAACAIR